MSEFTRSFYAGWRSSAWPVVALREDGAEPPERLLQAIWWHQRIRRDELRTADGRRLRVLHPGFWNREPGPDFRGAVLAFDDGVPVSGDVEVDIQARGWRDHRHHVNPSYREVILHVTWCEVDDAGPPVLTLRDILDAPMGELATWLGTETPWSFPAEWCGQCCGPLGTLDDEQLNQLLRGAASIRFQAKANQFQARARQVGWEQALWEGLFRGLGYKHNVWPMQRLGELRERLSRGERLSAFEWQSRLLGAGGLMPQELPRRRSTNARFVRQLWDAWWRDRAEFEDCLLPTSIWRRSGLRPANHPERRLAAMAHWLADRTLPAALEEWGTRPMSRREMRTSLAEIAHIRPDPFWSWHWTLSSARMGFPRPLLGPTRLTDLAVNVVLPWLWSRALGERAQEVRDELERRYFAWPMAEDNAILRLARKRLLGASTRRFLRTAAAQQGLMQIVRDFCEPSNALCSGCRFPELVRNWPD